jgi:hypothetical protein
VGPGVGAVAAADRRPHRLDDDGLAHRSSLPGLLPVYGGGPGRSRAGPGGGR